METSAIHGQTVPAESSGYESGGSINLIDAPVLNSSEGIYDRSVDCKKRFEHSIQRLKELNHSEAQSHGYDHDSSLFAIQDIFAHFKAWGNSIAAFQEVVVQTSLEFRLKEASEIKRRVLKILGNLQVSLHEATLIITGEEPNEWWPIDEFGDSEDKELDVDSEQTSELQELFKAMKDANANLMKLSMVIRSSPNRDDYLKAATRYKFDPSYDIGHVREKHGSAEGITDWLIARLGKAITRRRQFLKYREDHHGKLTRDWDEAAAFEKEDKTIALTKATSFIENPTAVRTDGPELHGSFGSQTSYEATIVGVSAGRLNVPSHPKMAFEDVPFEFGSPFRCPYCFTERVVKNRSAWKKHVFSDLRPYVCTFKECDMRMFRSRNEWFAHELQNHRREWVCEQCHNAPFPSSSSYKDHLRSMHHVEVDESQLKALVLQSEEPIDKVSATACRLCDEWKTNIEDTKYDFKRGFLNKGQPSQPYGTPLFALPMDEDIMEDDSLSDEEDHEELSISNTNREHISNEHPRQTTIAHGEDDIKYVQNKTQLESMANAILKNTSAQPNQDLDQETQVDGYNEETRSKPDDFDEHIRFVAKEKLRDRLEHLESFDHKYRPPSAPGNWADSPGRYIFARTAYNKSATSNADFVLVSADPSSTAHPQIVNSPKGDLPKSPVGTSSSIIQEKMTHDFKGAERKSLLYVQGEELERPAAKTNVAEDEQMEEAQTSLAFEVSKGRKDAADFAEAMEEVKDALDASQDLILLLPESNANVFENAWRNWKAEQKMRAEDPSPTREEEAPLGDPQVSKIPPDARWTKIDRRLVSPEALEIGKERFEVEDDFVTVLRILTKKEVQAYANETKKIRLARRGETNHETTSGNYEDRDRGQDRDRYKDHQEDARKKKNAYRADASSLSSIPRIPRATTWRSVGGPTGRTTFEDIPQGRPYGWSSYQQYEPSTMNQDRGVRPPSPPTRYKHDEEEFEPSENLIQAFKHAITVDSPDAKFNRQNFARPSGLQQVLDIDDTTKKDSDRKK
ncbi:hypothetical protein EYC80_000381 [Monilinia laxa]|uniref:C2H2-type domain-containing protein n=1 Tax=Monilinia laxa TaxID=61186 RepID=A0A5N6KAI8_MONLA|nr:hypothetical protein EYC80_000381 [Monilinia laxa]